MSIQCVSLTKHYGNKRALQEFSVTIREGRITGLVGPNGAGKSTLLKLMTGLVFPTAGYVMIDGFDVHARHREAMAHLGAVVEWPGFYPDLTARQNLAVFTGGHGKKYREKVDEITSFLNIRDVLDKKTGTFSTGMKQRLGIALAMLPDSRYVILDEPANGLDPAGIVEIRELIRECRTRLGVTVVISSHLLSEIEAICDDVIMIVDGKVRAAGELKDLLGSERLLRIIPREKEEMLSFFRRAFAGKRPWITALPESCGEELLVPLSREGDPGEVCEELCHAGLFFSRFAVEKKNLEEFYINSSIQGAK